MKINYSAIDLFCGIGGLSKGLQNSGIKIEVGIDLDETCRFAFEENLKAPFLRTDISEVKGKNLTKKYWGKENQIKILVGCAPCQPFSSHSNKVKGKQKNRKWFLLNEFLRLVEETSPHVISMENVPNLANKSIFKEFKTGLQKAGYHVYHENIFCPDYGIPQQRRRLVLLASKLGEIRVINKTHTPEKYETVKSAIGDLPEIKAGEVCVNDILHQSASLSDKNITRIKASKPGGTWLDWDYKLRLDCHKKESGNTYKAVYGRMSWDKPSPTITTQYYNYGTGRFGHPEQNRALSYREGAILQTFPKDYRFIEKKDSFSRKRIATHIGNAVPVKLAEVIGLSIKKHVSEYYE